MNPSEPTAAPQPTPDKPKRKRRWLTAVKWVAGIIIGLVVLLLLLVGVAVWILTPERLTPMVEKYGSEFIDGQVRVERVELTYWSTFPRLKLDVDSLAIISHSMKDLPAELRAQLPTDADTVLRVNGFSGSVNILRLLVGTIALNDVIIDSPRVTLVDATDKIANYNIFPTDTTATDTTRVSVPDLRFRRFAIVGDAPIRYYSLPDTIDFAVTLRRTEMAGDDAPSYKLDMNADARTRIGDINLDNLRLGMGGDIVWNHKEPYSMALEDFEAGVNNIHTVTSAKVDFGNELTIEALDFRMDEVPVTELLSLVPNDMLGELKGVKTDLRVKLSAKLTEPYKPVTTKYPSLEATVVMPDGTVEYDNLRLRTLSLDASARIDGHNLDRSVVDLKKFLAIGEGVGFELSATATNLITDPMVNGRFKGGIHFESLPSQLLQFIGCTVSGSLNADADFRFRMSDLDRNNFHKINLKGEATLSNFRCDMPEMPLYLFTRRADFKLGTSTSFVKGETAVDSLLTLSLKVDTLSCFMDGTSVELSSLMAGVGARNIASSTDSTIVNPLGAVISADRIRATMEADSSRITLRKLKARASLKRYQDMAKVPLLTVDGSLERLRFADRFNRASLRNIEMAFSAHPQAPKMGRRMRRAMDSIRAANPKISPDELYRQARALTPQRTFAPGDSIGNSGHETLDFDVDPEMASLLKKWNAKGSFKAERGRLMTPYFPVKNRISNLNLRFNNDSIIVRKVLLKTGQSDFLVSGTVSNLTRGLTSHGRSPLQLTLRVKSDTIDVNQLTAAAFAGAAFMEKAANDPTGRLAIADTADDEAVQRSINSAVDSTETGPLLLPANIRAGIMVDAKNIIYSDFMFHNLHGEVALFDGALNLRKVSMDTDVGSLALSALYEGLERDSLRFAFGMQVKDFRVGHFMDLVPSLDTIMPLLRDIDGIINADVAAASALDTMMNLKIPTLEASVSIRGDSLVLMDAQTFRKIGKWLLFKRKDRNIIDSMNVHLTIDDGVLQLYPFIFDIDRYKLGVFGSNDLAMNYKYHVAVLKSPIPFRFGINVSGNPDKMKIRLGGAKLNEKTVGESRQLADTTRINLINQIESVFRRGLRTARKAGRLQINQGRPRDRMPSLDDSPNDTISAADSLVFINAGLIERPDSVAAVKPLEPKAR